MHMRVIQYVQANSDQHWQWILFCLYLLHWSGIQAIVADMNVQLPDCGQGLKKNGNWLGGIYANQEGSEELSGNHINGCSIHRNEAHILLLPPEGALYSCLCLQMIGLDQGTLDAPHVWQWIQILSSRGSLKPQWRLLWTGEKAVMGGAFQVAEYSAFAILLNSSQEMLCTWATPEAVLIQVRKVNLY